MSERMNYKRARPLNQLFIPPAFRSYEAAQKAKLVYYMLVAWLIGLLTAAVRLFSDWDFVLALSLFIFASASIIALALNHFRRYNLAAIILTVSILTGINYAIFKGIGLHDASVLGYPIFILTTTFLFKRLGLLLATVLSVFSIVGLYWLENSGHILSSYSSSSDRVFVYIIILLVMALITWVVRDTWETNLTQMRDSYDLTLAGWVKILEFRDQETEGHTQRAAQNCIVLARALGVNEEDLVDIRRGAYLHDIGKMAIPDSILRKVEPLVPEEWQVIKDHPQRALDMISQIPHLQTATDIPYSHHENWDGSGYPQGLRGEEIPMAARIFAVVDTWDALTSDRAYRKAWPKNEVIEYIRQQSGKKFDPFIVDVFLSPGFIESLK